MCNLKRVGLRNKAFAMVYAYLILVLAESEACRVSFPPRLAKQGQKRDVYYPTYSHKPTTLEAPL